MDQQWAPPDLDNWGLLDDVPIGLAPPGLGGWMDQPIRFAPADQTSSTP